MKKRKDKGRDGMPIVRVLRSVVVAVQGPVCFYLPIKAVLRVGVLLVVALDRQGRMLATSETPRWQGRAPSASAYPSRLCCAWTCSWWCSTGRGACWPPQEPPQWQGRALQAICISDLCCNDPVLPGECSQWPEWME